MLRNFHSGIDGVNSDNGLDWTARGHILTRFFFGRQVGW